MSQPVFADRNRAESFGSVAATYERFRPSYPVSMVDDLVALGGREVLDVGCGTGKAATLFAARGLDVLGVEIDAKMAEVARARGVTVEVDSFEGWDAHGRTFDLLTCGQAWHWVDPERAVPKAADVVRPGGHLALFWNDDRPDPDVHGRLDKVYREHAPELMADSLVSDMEERPYVAPVEASEAFDLVETRTYAWQRTFTADEWVGLCLTHSNHVVLPAARRTVLAEAMRAALEPLGAFAVPYETYLVLARRVAA